ncbi:MAG TPA: hypothetical protein DG577_09305 [Firmicutes bacterium]|jgi:RNA polymerase sigma-70 factor (ECF subfamily)|nr:hypothetical protein [Bacillota bacterium]
MFSNKKRKPAIRQVILSQASCRQNQSIAGYMFSTLGQHKPVQITGCSCHIAAVLLKLISENETICGFHDAYTVKDGETMVDQNIISLFNCIYDNTNRKVLRFITAKCNNTSDISDIFQDTYMELYAVMVKRGLDYIANSEAFVMNIAKQKVYRHYSLLTRLKFAIPLSVADEDGNEINIADLEANYFSFNTSMLNSALIAEIKRAISAKPQIVQKIFLLRYSLDMTIPEIAELLSVGESYVKNKLYRTRNELRELYVRKDGID